MLKFFSDFKLSSRATCEILYWTRSRDMHKFVLTANEIENIKKNQMILFVFTGNKINLLFNGRFHKLDKPIVF